MEESMKWHCIDCHSDFQGPKDRTPANGCERCGSKNIFDCNVKDTSKEKIMTSDIHIIPLNDLRTHLENRKCPCNPQVKHGRIIIHNSYDGREFDETEGPYDDIVKDIERERDKFIREKLGGGSA